jgi:tetratricopeptide (TPR) repeat protein
VTSLNSRTIEEGTASLRFGLDDCKQKPYTIFTPVARLSTKECLDGTWTPLPTLSVVAQLRALAEEDDTLDAYPQGIPAEAIMKGATWCNLQQTPTWHRKLAVCLQNLNHLNKSVGHFEQALKLDHTLVEARDGLATVYRKKSYFVKVIELELTNISLLKELIQATSSLEPADTLRLSRQLCYSHEAVANASQDTGDSFSAMQHWREAAKTGEIRFWDIPQYLELLAASTNDSRRLSVMEMFQSMQKTTSGDGLDRLTS